MPEIQSLYIFVIAALIMLITPGPAVLYIVARSIEQGRMAGIISALGVALGGLCHVLFAALGLSIILVQSAVAFTLVKYLGAAYLIYLAVMKIIQKDGPLKNRKIEKKKLFRIFIQGFVVNILNPKTAIFFMAFLPQFVNPYHGSLTQQIIYLGLIFIVLAILSDSAYALLAGSLRKLFTSTKVILFVNRYIPSAIYLALGIGTLFFKNSRQ